MKSGVSPQKLRKYRWQTQIWASICTPVAPSLLISSVHSPRLGGAQSPFGGAQAVIWEGTAPECPPVAPGLYTISLPPQKIPFLKFLMTSLHVICNLPPPDQKS